MTAVMIATTTASIRRDIERQRILLWQGFLSASTLFIAMGSNSRLFDMSEISAQNDAVHAAINAFTACESEYHNLGKTEED